MSSTGKLIHEDFIIQEFFKKYDYLQDEDYSIWEKEIYDENYKFTFERTLNFCKMVIDESVKEEIKNKWLEHIREWNSVRYEREKDNNENTIVGYAAITYMYLVYPYAADHTLNITEFQAKLINICMLHETGKNLECFKDYDMLTVLDPPHNPEEFQQMLDLQYNSACWFLTFLVYLDRKGIKLNHNMAIWTI